MPFNPEQKYKVIEKPIYIRDFYEYKEDYIIRPHYQRKNVWSKNKMQTLLDSLFRRYYIPKIVIREVRLDKNKTYLEIIDGQQRITTVQEFFNNSLKLPKSLKDLHPDLSGKYYEDLNTDFRKFINKELLFNADIVIGIDDPTNPEHLEVATEIFWRLQQGESLNYMEVAHARLSSLSRNFIVKYSDDISYDYENYIPLDENPCKHSFFNIIDRKNDRMQHLMLMARFLLIEEYDGPAEINNSAVEEIVAKFKMKDGIGNFSFENENIAKKVLSNLNEFYAIFKEDPMIDDNNGMKEFKREYMIISFYLLLRHLKKYYIFGEKEREVFRDFLNWFYNKWTNKEEDDIDIMNFTSNRQQSLNNVEIRDRILKNLFFDFVNSINFEMTTKDEKRAFNEAEKIRIYRRDKGLCQICLEEGKNEKEAKVSWSEYEADHIIPHSKGGQTEVFNGPYVLG